MIGTIINTLAILAGGLVGLLLRKGLPERMRAALTQGMGLCVMVIGVSGAIKTQNTLMVILSVVIGGALGALIGLEARMKRAGAWVQTKLSKSGGEGLGKAFVSATLLFCVGSMAVVGAMDSGLRGDHATLLAKSVLDGISSVILAGTLGAGVLLSAASVLIYQGSIALLSKVVAPILSQTAVGEMSAVGSVLLIGIGLNMIRKERIPVGDMLPAVFVPLLLTLLM